MVELRNFNLHEGKKVFREGIDEGPDPGAVAVAKPRLASPGTWVSVTTQVLGTYCRYGHRSLRGKLDSNCFQVINLF